MNGDGKEEPGWDNGRTKWEGSSRADLGTGRTNSVMVAMRCSRSCGHRKERENTPMERPKGGESQRLINLTGGTMGGEEAKDLSFSFSLLPLWFWGGCLEDEENRRSQVLRVEKKEGRGENFEK